METPPAPLSFESAINFILFWNTEPTEQFISDCDRSEIRHYLQAVYTIQQSASLAPYRHEAEQAIPMVVSRLKHEFHNILTKVTATPPRVIDLYTGTSSTSMTTTTFSSHELHEAAATTTKNSEAVYDLWSIAEWMTSVGPDSECIQIYKSVRKAFLHTSLQRFQVENLRSSDTRGLFSKELKAQIDHCVRACNACHTTLFPMEMQLCEQIFKGVERDVCYSETIEDSLVQLIGHADSLISARRLPELLFKYLDLYEALLDIWPPSGFSRTKHWGGLVNVHILNQLVEKIRCILSDFEKSVAHELSTAPEAGGGIVFLTKYVMDYVMLIVEYEDILSKLIVSKPSTRIAASRIPDVEFQQLAGRTPLELHLIFIVVVLRFQLESKSKYYKGSKSLFHLFLTNNLAYVVRCIQESSELEAMIGEEYMNKLKENYLRQAMRNYQISICDKMLCCLRNDEGGCLSNLFIFSGVSTSTFKRRIKSFYTLFEEAHSNRAKWVVTDLQLREQLCLSIVEELVPAYKSFLDRFKCRVERTKHSYVIDDYVRYSPEQIQTLISKDFFRI